MTSVARRPEKKNSWSFGFKAKKDIKAAYQASNTTTSSTLSKEFFTELIKLEADFFNGTYTLETLNELTQYYAKAVEHYDHNKDDISTYFIFKIQDILATQKSLTMLSLTHQKDGNKDLASHGECSFERSGSIHLEESTHKRKLVGSHIIEEDSEDEEETEAAKIERERQLNRHQNTSHSHSDFNQMRTRKQQFVHFFYKMENEIEHEKKTLKLVLEDFKDLGQKNDNSIQNGLNNQRQRLREKLEQRKYKTFASQTLNMNSFSRNPVNFADNLEVKVEKNGSTLESMLKALDDGEDLDYRKFISKPGSINGEMMSVNSSMYDECEFKSTNLNNPTPNKNMSRIKSDDDENTKPQNVEKNVALLEKIKENEDPLEDAVFEAKVIENNSDCEKLSTDKDTSSDKDNSIGEKL